MPGNGVDRVVLAVTCFDNGQNSIDLESISREWALLSAGLTVFLITNNPNQPDILDFLASEHPFEVSVVSPSIVGHPYLLTWIHREVFLNAYKLDESISHFVYLEDDILFTKENFNYWIDGLQELKALGLIPGFLRVEEDISGKLFSSDVLMSDTLASLPRVRTEDQQLWINLRFCYQGMYVLDRELFREFVHSDAFTPDHGFWGLRERATQGLLFEKVPHGCFSRHFLRYLPGQGIDTGALIRHTSNRYVNDESSRFGRIQIEKVVQERRRTLGEMGAEFRKAVRIERSVFQKRMMVDLSKTAGHDGYGPYS